MRTSAESVIDYWLNDVGQKGWYMPPEGLDDQIRERFEGAWNEAMNGELKGWTCSPTGALGKLILLDQFPRNMFRDTAKAYASDAKALKIAKLAISKGFDLATPLPERQFFYLPLEHSEIQSDQDHCVRLIKMNMESAELLRHAKAHRDVIRRFGRFPYRNVHLGRKSTEAELAYIQQGGYRYTLEQIAA